jgi:carbon-monoxide dehydrogenase small subunit
MEETGYQSITIKVNGRTHNFAAGKDFNMEDSLSKVLREKLGYTGVRVSCEQGACGACTVLLNGESALSCMILAIEADGADVTTIEGLPEDDFVISSFAEMNEPNYGTAMQCGFCTPGFVLETHSLLAKNANPSKEDIRDGLSGHICRCGCYQGIGRAVESAAEKMNGRCESCTNQE